MTTSNDDDKVGYGNPPKHSQFRKGQSGNARGRPKNSRNFGTDLQEVLGGEMTITENGRPKKISTQLAALLRLREKALKGDPRALDRFLGLAQQNSEVVAARAAERELTSGEDEILQRYNRHILVLDKISTALDEEQGQADGE